MSRGSSRLPFRIAICAALAAAVVMVLAACGSSGSDQKLTFEYSGKGPSAEFSAPKSADSGKAEITFANESDAPADLQLIRVEGDHSPEEVIEGLGAAQQGKPFPAWFFAGGGTATVKPGSTETVTQVLEPGTYYPFATESRAAPDPKTLVSLKVSGDQSEEELEADTTVTASEYKFEAEDLKAGKDEIDFHNAGVQPHHLIISPLKGDATAEEVEKAFKSKGGQPPLEEKGTQNTAVIEGGESQLVEVDLKPGRYAFYCFITDRQGGPPHALKGMVDEFEVK